MSQNEGILIYCSKRYFKTTKGLEKGYSIKGLDLEVELPHLKLCRIPPPPLPPNLSLCNKDVQIVFWKKAKNKTEPI